MYRGHTIGVVVPAYNEEGFVGEVIETMPSFVDRVYVVDDRSTDGTWEEIERAAERENTTARGTVADGGEEFSPRVVTIRHEDNRGVGGAIKTGYLRAREDGIDATAVMAGDGQMDPAMLDDILDPIVEGQADYVKANRLLYPEDRADMPRFRMVGNFVLTYLTKLASGYWTISDPQDGYTAISLRALEGADIEGMYEYYGYCNDLLVKLNVADMRVADVPRESVYADETSHITYSEYIPRVSGMLFRNFLWRLGRKHLMRDTHPFVFLYAFGALGWLGSLLSGVAAALWKQSRVARALMSVGLFVLGGLAFTLAMVYDRRANENLDTRVADRDP